MNTSSSQLLADALTEDPARDAERPSPQLLVPAGADVLWSPRAPFATPRRLQLPVGSQAMTVWHVSDMALGRRLLSSRSKPTTDDPGATPALSTAFEPAPLRWIRRHAGLAGALLGRHPNYGGPWMLDEPRLGAARELLMAPFRPAGVEPLDAVIRTTCQQVLEEHLRRDAGVVDIAAYSNEVLFILMAHLLGAEPGTARDTAARFRRWMHRFNESPSLAHLHRQPDIYRWIARMIRDHRGAPGILTEVQAARRRRDTLGGPRPATTADYVALVWALVAAGTDTPGTVAAQSVWFGLGHGTLAGLTSPASAHAAVAESLRYYPPFPKPLMRVTGETPLGADAHARPGEWIELHLPAMNRDPAFFDRPDVYDPARRDAGSARTFGGGAHRCIGSHYGTRVAEQILRTVAARLPAPSPVPGHTYTRHAGLLHRLEQLPLRTGLR